MIERGSIRVINSNQGFVSMGRQGRYGKYGENKRLECLRQAGVHNPPQKAKVHPVEGGSFHRKRGPKSDPIRIVASRASDIDFIKRLSGSAFRKYGCYQGVIAQWFQSEMTETVIGQVNGRPVGFAMVGVIPDKTSDQNVCELLAIAVEPAKQKRGIGEMLLKAAEKKASEQLVGRIFLHTAKDNFAAVDLFTRTGYVSSGLKKHFYPEGQDAFIMSKSIHFNPSASLPSAKTLRLSGKKRKPSNF